MTEFEQAVDNLMSELQKEIGSGLVTHRALELMPAVQRHLVSIKKFEKAQRQLILPPENGPQAEGKKE